MTAESHITRGAKTRPGKSSAGYVNDLPEVGEIVAGKYEVTGVIGEGGMGIVMRAKHLSLGVEVALKFVRRSAWDDFEVINRFDREARAAALLSSPHVAKVFDMARLPSGVPYMAMEFLPGLDLSQVIKKEKYVPAKVAVGYVLQACDGIACAHAAGIIHRDLKPSNLFLTDRNGDQVIKVLDFGVSKIVHQSLFQDPTVTASQSVMGSPMYMAPEQLGNARDADERSDIYGLGAILYELLSGSTPYDCESYPQLIAEVLDGSVRPISSVAPECPVQLRRVVNKCLHHSPKKRYQNVAELAAALEPLAANRFRGTARRIAKRLGVEVEQVANHQRRRVRRTRLAMGLAAGLMALGVVFFAGFVRGLTRSSTVPASSVFTKGDMQSSANAIAPATGHETDMATMPAELPPSAAEAMNIDSDNQVSDAVGPRESHDPSEKAKARKASSRSRSRSRKSKKARTAKLPETSVPDTKIDKAASASSGTAKAESDSSKNATAATIEEPTDDKKILSSPDAKSTKPKTKKPPRSNAVIDPVFD